MLHTAYFEGGQRGWTESYAQSRQSGNLDAAVVALYPFWQKRAVLSGTNTKIKATKCSAISDKGDSYLTYVNFFGTQTETVNDYESSVNVQLTTANGRYRKLTFLRGCWDSVFFDAYFQDNNAPWVSLFNSWRQELLAQRLGWMGQVATPPEAFVNNYESLENGLVGFTLQAPLLAGVPLYKKVEVSLSGFGKGSVLNRRLVVIPQSPTTAITAAPIAVAPYAGIGFMRLPSYELKQAEVVNLQRIGRRPAGAPLLQPLGRGRNRARY